LTFAPELLERNVLAAERDHEMAIGATILADDLQPEGSTVTWIGAREQRPRPPEHAKSAPDRTC
jgi:hypothetical protein